MPASSPHTEPTIASTARHFQTVKPATVPISRAGPTMAEKPVFDPNSRTRLARAAAVLYVEEYASACVAR